MEQFQYPVWECWRGTAPYLYGTVRRYELTVQANGYGQEATETKHTRISKTHHHSLGWASIRPRPVKTRSLAQGQ